MREQATTLRSLVGEHVLDAVDFSNQQVETWSDQFEDCQVMRFRLDGVAYSVVEDPSDGYRSSMRDIAVSDIEMTNVFEGVRVFGRMRERGEWGGTDDVFELLDMVTGKVVLEAGTANRDDYYPSFVAAFHPEAMCINADKADGPPMTNSKIICITETDEKRLKQRRAEDLTRDQKAAKFDQLMMEARYSIDFWQKLWKESVDKSRDDFYAGAISAWSSMLYYAEKPKETAAQACERTANEKEMK